MFIHAAAFWGCGLLPGYLLAYRFNMGIYGFLDGIDCLAHHRRHRLGVVLGIVQ